MKYVFVIAVIIASLVFAQVEMKAQTTDQSGGKSKAKNIVLLSSVGQNGIGNSQYGNVSHDAGILAPFKMSMTIERMPDIDNTPAKFTIGEPYPNPFNSVCKIDIILPEPADMRIEVLDLSGHKLYERSEHRETGAHAATFDAGELPSGTYLIKVVAGDHRVTRRILLMK